MFFPSSFLSHFVIELAHRDDNFGGLVNFQSLHGAVTLGPATLGCGVCEALLFMDEAM